jgi:single-stranded-DNA-specific exonuclease
VASRLVERYYRPALVFGENAGKLRFSGRSTHAINLFSVLDDVRENFLAFGGHYYAVGLTLDPERVNWLTGYMNTEVEKRVSAGDHLKPLDLDAEISLESLDNHLLNSIETLEPFGVANPRPRWLVRDVEVRHVKRIGKDPAANHARVLLSDGSCEAWLTAFSFAEDFEKAQALRSHLDIVVDGRMQVWNGKTRAELRLVDCHLRSQ